MKSYKLIMGLALVAATFTSCSSDGPDYNGSENVVTPPAYFNLAQASQVVDLGENDTEFSIPVYRADNVGEKTVNITCTVTDAEGKSASNLFTVPTTVTFADGSNTATFTPTFSIPNLAPNMGYTFQLKLEGESTPYFTTSAAYIAIYTPWEIIPDCWLKENAALAMFNGISEEEWEVTVMEHPTKKGFFRVLHPYASGPYAELYTLPIEDTNYLYINATNPAEVYFCDSNMQPVITYDTGIVLDPEYGKSLLQCCYSTVLLETTFDWGGKKYLNSNFTEDAGDFKFVEGAEVTTGMIRLNKLCACLSKYESGFFDIKKFEIRLNGYESGEWADLGMATYTDGFLGQAYGEDNLTYQVPVQMNTETEGLYRVVTPYNSNYWPLGDDNKYNLEIDCSNPEFVTVDLQTIFSDADGDIQLLNYGMYMTQYQKADKAQTPEQIIEAGLNDTFADNTITIKHGMLVFGDKAYAIWQQWKGTPATTIVLPDGAAAASKKAVAARKAAKKASANKAVKPGKFKGTNKLFMQQFKVK